MYVRTNLGVIAKLTRVFNFKHKTYYLNYCNAAVNCLASDVVGNKGKIINTSHNIIDLIELDDYVNGEKVILTQRYAKVNDKQGICLIQTDAYDIRDDEQFLIKSIVTHEQFENISYKVN